MTSFASRVSIHGIRDLVRSYKRKTKSRFVWTFVILVSFTVLLWNLATAVIYYSRRPVAASITMKGRATLPALYFDPVGVLASKEFLRRYNLTEDTLVYLAGFVPYSRVESEVFDTGPAFNAASERFKIDSILRAENKSLHDLISSLVNSVIERGRISQALPGKFSSGLLYRIWPDQDGDLGIIWLTNFEEFLPGTLKQIYTHGNILYGSPDEHPLSLRDWLSFPYGGLTRFTFEQVTAPGWSGRGICVSHPQLRAAYDKAHSKCRLEVDTKCACLPLTLATEAEQTNGVGVYCNNRDGPLTWAAPYKLVGCLENITSSCQSRLEQVHASKPPCVATTYSARWTTESMARATGGPHGRTYKRGTDLFFATAGHGRSMVMEEQPLYSWQKLLSQIGGLMSLLFGASLISLAQLIYHAAKAACKTVRRKRAKKASGAILVTTAV